MLKMYDFHMDFQFPGQKSLPRDLQMDMASPWQLKWASFLAMGLLVQILFSRHSLCIYPYVKTCPFFLRPTFFFKKPAYRPPPALRQVTQHLHPQGMHCRLQAGTFALLSPERELT